MKSTLATRRPDEGDKQEGNAATRRMKKETVQKNDSSRKKIVPVESEAGKKTFLASEDKITGVRQPMAILEKTSAPSESGIVTAGNARRGGGRGGGGGGRGGEGGPRL